MPRASMMIALVVLLRAILAGSGLAHDERATPATPRSPAGLPIAAAPFGLDDVTLPTDRAGIEALFDRLPGEVVGHSRALERERSSDRIIVGYGTPHPVLGPPLSLRAITFEGGDFFPPDFTAGQFVARVVTSDDFGAVAHGQDGDLVWVQAENIAADAGDDSPTPELTRPLYTLSWGTTDGRWLFGADATDQAALEALVTAFVTAATGDPATPEPDASPTARVA